MATRGMNRLRYVIPGALVAGCVALGAFAPAYARAQASPPMVVTVRLVEKNIGPAELPSPGPTPTPNATAAASPSAQSTASPSPSPSPSPAARVWKRVPNGTSPQGAAAPPAATSTTQAGMAGGGAAMPSATPTPLAPIGIGAITPTLPISNQPLKPLIAQAPTPALAASLRLTDEARKQILANQPGKAMHFLTNALSIDPLDSYAYLYLGRAWLQKKNYSQAMIFFNRAETAFASNPRWLGETLAFEGLAYEESGQDAQAEQAYAQALQVSPGNLMALVGYTRLSVNASVAPGVIPTVPTTASETVPPAPSEAPASPPPASAPPPAAN